MATVEEMGSRLMRAAKELADWNFPFSESVQKYCRLLEAEHNVNLNKAALVLQNSANTYVRRVEYLFIDTTSLIQTFVDQEAERETKKNTKKDGKERKTVIDIIDFETIDFTQYIAKNINLKNRNANPVKLLGQRFPQLENSSRSLKSDQVNSTGNDQEQDNDQDAARKYPFRCNQYVTSSGVLVEHLTPEDLPNDSCSRRSVISNVSKENAELAAISNSENVLDHQDFTTPLADTENDLGETSFVSTGDSGRGSSIRTPLRPESSLSIDREANWSSLEPRCSSRLSMTDLRSPIESFHDSGICTETPANSPRKRSADDENCLEKNELATKSEAIVNENLRRSKRLRNLQEEIENCNSRTLEPIPFGGVVEECSKSKKEFKPPSQMPLFMPIEKPQKRKAPDKHNKKSPKKSRSQNAAIRGKSKTSQSPTKQLFFPFGQNDFEVLPKSLQKYLKNLRELSALEPYEAVEDESANLLGYKNNNEKPNVFDDENSKSDDVTTTDILDTIEDFPMPDTPESFSGPEPAASTPFTYNDRIERLVYDIQENADVRTEQEEAVMEWHKNIQVKLKEIEKRPKFEMADYTSRVIKNLKKNNGKIDFHRMCQKEKRTEVSRYLLASLMLANKCNVHIDSNGAEGNVTLQLLRD